MIPTEPIGSVPCPESLREAISRCGGILEDPQLDELFEQAVRDNVAAFEAAGSPVVTDGEPRRYHDLCEYCVHDIQNVERGGFEIPSSNGRRMPRLVRGPFHYKTHPDRELELTLRYAHGAVKQSVVSPSVLSMLYPVEGIDGYSREQFIEDLVTEHVADVRRCLIKGAHTVQIDFSEANLAIALDPTGALLASFLDLTNIALSRFSSDERKRLGVHHCRRMQCSRGDVDVAGFLPSLMQLNVTNFYVSLAGEADRVRILEVLGKHLKPDQRVFIGVVSPDDPRLESPEEIRDRVREAATFIPVEQLGTTDDCGFSTAPSRSLSFAKIRARVRGTDLAARALRAS